MATDKTVGKVFCQACADGNVEKVRHCIALDVDVNCAKPTTGLIVSSANNHYQVVDLLLQQPGITPTEGRPQTSIGTALSAGVLPPVRAGGGAAPVLQRPPNLQHCPTCRGQMTGRATAFD